MARISTYAQDPLLEGADRVIGSDASNANATMNFSLDSLGDFYTRTGTADATRLAYRFMVGDAAIPGTGEIVFSSGTEFSNIIRINISASDFNGLATSVLNGLIEDTRLKIVSARSFSNINEIAQGYYSVGTVEPIETPSGTITGYEIVLTHITSSGSFRTGTDMSESDNEFIVIPLPGGTGTGTGTGVNDGVVVSGGYDAATGVLSLNRSEGLDAVEVTGFPTGNAPGTVTSITTGTGLTGGPITVTGEIALDTATQTTLTQVGTNTAGISTNSSAIATNASGILSNDGDIATNAGDISTNTGNISTNATAIGTNATDIGTNATNIGNNTTAIGLNTDKRTYPEEDEAKLALFTNPDDSAAGTYNIEIAEDGTVTYVQDTLPVDATTPEQVEDIVGAMIALGDQSGITVEYQSNDTPLDPTARGQINFTVAGVTPPTRSFNRALTAAPSAIQQTGAARTWSITLAQPTQDTFTDITFGTPSIDNTTDYTITASDTTSVTVTNPGTSINTTIVHVPITYTHNMASTTVVGTITIGLEAPPPAPTEYTSFSGIYATGDGSEDIPDLPTDATGLTELEIQNGHQFVFPSTADIAYAVVQIETQDLVDAGTTNVAFQEVIGGQLHDISFDGAGDMSTTQRPGFTSFRFIYGPDAYTVQININ